MRFRWTEWNCEHIARHGVAENEVEEVVRALASEHSARRDGTVVTSGRTAGGRKLYVVWREDDATDIFADIESEIFVITAYPV